MLSHSFQRTSWSVAGSVKVYLRKLRVSEPVPVPCGALRSALRTGYLWLTQNWTCSYAAAQKNVYVIYWQPLCPGVKGKHLVLQLLAVLHSPL